jgi:HEAT repeat protein
MLTAPVRVVRHRCAAKESKLLAPRCVGRVATVLLLGLPAVFGCQSPGWWHTVFDGAAATTVDSEDGAVANATGDQKSSPARPAPSEISAVDATETGDKATDPADKATAPTASPIPDNLADDRWVMTVRPMVPGVNEPATRWRHPALDALLAAPPNRRPAIQSALTSDKPALAANAAIVLGRWQQQDTSVELARAIRNESLKLPQRQAAIETLAILNTPAASQTLVELLSRDDRAADAPLTLLVDVPELYSELLYARSQYVHPREEAAFEQAFASRSPIVRAEAAAAWARATPPLKEQTPSRLVDMCTDSDTRVRLAAIRAVAVHRHPRAGEVLDRATRDFDVNVRMAAITALGEMGTHDAKQVLDRLRRDPSEVARAAAVGALAAAGANEVVLAAAKDESYRVRQAVANSLDELKSDAKDLGNAYQSLAQKLVRDTSVEVQRSAVASLRAWPLEQAGPALLLAMSEGGYSTRKLAAESLADRWEPAREFYVDGTADNRAKQLAQLRSLWEQEFGTLEDYALRAAGKRLAAVGVSPAQLKQIESAISQLSDPAVKGRLRAESLEILRGLGPELAATLEDWTHDQLRRLPPEVYESVLSKINPAFGSIEKLTEASATARRTALVQLRKELAEQKLPKAALARLIMLMERETDPLVWQAALGLVASDPREIALRLAYMAVANASSEVRRRACENMRHCPAREHTAVLLPILQDPNVQVAIAAARALGAAGIEDPAPLVPLLGTPDHRLRLELAIALARSEIEQGIAALERLAREADSDIRRSAAQAMGELENPVFVPTLLALLDDRHDVQNAALASLARVTGHNIQQGDELSVLPDEKCRRWKAWHSQQQSNTDKPSRK